MRLRIAFAALLFAVSSLALAAGVQTNQTISSTEGQSSGAFFISFPNSASGSPSCVAGAYSNAFTIDPTTANGRALIAIVMFALATGKTVTAGGTGQCTLYPGAEDLLYIQTTG